MPFLTATSLTFLAAINFDLFVERSASGLFTPTIPSIPRKVSILGGVTETRAYNRVSDVAGFDIDSSRLEFNLKFDIYEAPITKGPGLIFIIYISLL